MLKNNLNIRVLVAILLTCLINLLVMVPLASGQAPECAYDVNNPSLESARISFKSLNYLCAEKEINDFLGMDNITLEQKADAHVLLAAVYYAKVKDESEKRNRVINQFKEAFRAYRDWRGELDISSTEFIAMMNEAQAMVDRELEQVEQPTAEEEEEEKPAVPPAMAAETGKAAKPWYTQWWAIGLGVGLVAGAVVLVSGGGDGNGGGGVVTDTLPGFPDTPSGK